MKTHDRNLITGDGMAIRDGSFMQYLNNRVKDPLLFTLRENAKNSSETKMSTKS